MTSKNDVQKDRHVNSLIFSLMHSFSFWSGTGDNLWLLPFCTDILSTLLFLAYVASPDPLNLLFQAYFLPPYPQLYGTEQGLPQKASCRHS